MHTTTHAKTIIARLQKQYPLFETALEWREPWQLLVAVVLSAQTTDENVNAVTKKLFKKYPAPKAIAQAKQEELEKDVYSTGYYKSKARNIKSLCTDLIEKHLGEVPDTMQKLTQLPGVGRKTANVVLHVLYKKTEGIVMDTHIARVTHRLGFTQKKDPLIGEKIMMHVLPKEEWKTWGDLLIQHGRIVCQARNPRCNKCVLNDICPNSYQFKQFTD
jgi:endonuclease III